MFLSRSSFYSITVILRMSPRHRQWGVYVTPPQSSLHCHGYVSVTLSQWRSVFITPSLSPSLSHCHLVTITASLSPCLCVVVSLLWISWCHCRSIIVIEPLSRVSLSPSLSYCFCYGISVSMSLSRCLHRDVSITLSHTSRCSCNPATVIQSLSHCSLFIFTRMFLSPFYSHRVSPSSRHCPQLLSREMYLSYCHRRLVTVMVFFPWSYYRPVTMQSVFVTVPLFPVTVLGVCVMASLSFCHCHGVSVTMSLTSCICRGVSVTPSLSPCHCHRVCLSSLSFSLNVFVIPLLPPCVYHNVYVSLSLSPFQCNGVAATPCFCGVSHSVTVTLSPSWMSCASLSPCLKHPVTVPLSLSCPLCPYHGASVASPLSLCHCHEDTSITLSLSGVSLSPHYYRSVSVMSVMSVIITLSLSRRRSYYDFVIMSLSSFHS